MANEVNTMPYNRDAEMALLGCMLIDSDIASDIVDQLDEEDFYQESHKYFQKHCRYTFFMTDIHQHIIGNPPHTR